MRKLDPEASCVCGSGRVGHSCCIINSPPVGGELVGFDHIRLSAEGVYVPDLRSSSIVAIPASLPEKLSITSTLKNPFQLDPDVEETMELLFGLLEAREKEVGRDVAGRLWSDLENGLYATRYHQRQYIVRHRAIYAHSAKATVTGSGQIELIWHDVPLKAELEAVLLRSRGVLDTVGRIALTTLGKKGDKFGALWSFVKSPGIKRVPKGPELGRILSTYERWLETGKKLRDAVAHGGSTKEFRGPKVGIAGVDPARMQRDDAGEYVISMWREMIKLVQAVLRTLTPEALEK